MWNIPVRFNRVAAAFDEVARVRSCDESSGSEHSADLSDLVNSFLERDDNESAGRDKDWNEMVIDDDDDNEEELESYYGSTRDALKDLFDLGFDGVKRNIHAAVEMAYRDVAGGKSSSSLGFKRRLMAELRSQGFDAGLCKSKWERNGRCPSGDYAYVDVNAGGERYIVEVYLAGEFTIARPTNRYDSLLDNFPPVYVGKPDELKQVVRMMCRAIRKSMKTSDLRVPPWRRQAYLQSKWFGSYKRTINDVPAQAKASNTGVVSSGFLATRGIKFCCREDFAARGAARIGNLAAALSQNY